VPGEEPRQPSLRRVLAGYLRLRSPYNLCLDGFVAFAASYMLSAAQQWLEVQTHRAMTGPSQDGFSAWWFYNQAALIVVALIYSGGVGVFLVGLARIIADRLGPPSEAGP
jgi:hypothetical protein